MMSLGQTRSQVPQPVQSAGSTWGSLSSPMVSAPKGQAATQVPRPMQPTGHSLGPPAKSAAARQSFTPSYWNLRSALSVP